MIEGLPEGLTVVGYRRALPREFVLDRGRIYRIFDGERSREDMLVVIPTDGWALHPDQPSIEFGQRQRLYKQYDEPKTVTIQVLVRDEYEEYASRDLRGNFARSGLLVSGG
jgi:hypothetical protein